MTTESQPLAPAASTAAEPFDDVNADLVLRSSDRVDFRVFKCILSLTSPIFKDMFTIGAPTLQHSSNPPVVPLSESSTTLDVLFRFIYPGVTQANPLFDTFNDAKLFLAAIAKYDIVATVRERALEIVNHQFLAERPVSIYAVACELGWQDLAQIAARETLKSKELARPAGYVEELETLTAGAFHRLLSYHHNCGVAASSAIGSFRRPGGMCGSFAPSRSCPNGIDNSDHEWVINEYVAVYRKELLSRPHPSIIGQFPIGTWDSGMRASPMKKICLRMPIYLDTFRESFTAHIEEVVSKVELEFRL
ncbi:hypothetical protein V8B97DRAFT_2012745 [Scleroderma yunnanense]